MKNIKRSKANADTYEMFFGRPSYGEERRQRYQHGKVDQNERRQRFQHGKVDQNESRTAGFEQLGNKDELAKRLTKTKVCRNLVKFGKCTRKVCTFAHTPEELNDPECVFSTGCRKRSKCTFKHGDETSEEYRNRLGIKFPVKKELSVVVENSEGEINYYDIVRSVINEKRETMPRSFKIVPTKTPPPTPPPTPIQKLKTGETVLQATPDMAAQLMQLAVEQGYTNIRLEMI